MFDIYYYSYSAKIWITKQTTMNSVQIKLKLTIQFI